MAKPKNWIISRRGTQPCALRHDKPIPQPLIQTILIFSFCPMSQPKNETSALITALILTVAVVGAGGWWLKSSGIIGGGSPDSDSAEVTQPSAEAASGGQPVDMDRSFSGGPFTDVSNIPNGRFFYGGSTSWAPLRSTFDPQVQQAQPGFSLVYKDASGSSEGIEMLINGELAFAQSSRPLTQQEEQQAQQQGLSLQAIPVAIEAVAIAAHPDLPIPGLTLNQIKDIYTGSITNWNQVGGPNLPIVPVSRNDSGTVQFFQETVLNGQPFAPTVQRINTTTAAIRFVSENPGAIYYASAPEIVGQCTVAPLPIGTSSTQLVAPYQNPYVSPASCPAQRNQLNLDAFAGQTYPLIRPLFVIVRQDGQLAEQAGTAYAQLLQTEEGSELLKEAGFVPLP